MTIALLEYCGRAVHLISPAVDKQTSQNLLVALMVLVSYR